jgi:hyperosmotically inducible protein
MKIYRHILVVLLVTGLLNGCAALVVGGAAGGAAGAYYVEKDKRSFAEITSDTGITSSINTKFLQDDLVSAIDVNVDTHKGVVTLKGVVSTYEVARRAYDIAYSVEGVTQVISKLTIRSEPMSPWGPVAR